MRVTIKDIAKKAKVSPITVSRALNDKQDICPATKKKIVKLAQGMGYFPNMLARSLKSKKSKTLGVIIRDIDDSFYAEILQGIAQEAFKNDYQIVLSVSSKLGFNMEHEFKILMMLLEKQVDGLLIIPEHEDAQYFSFLQKISTPFVLLNRIPRGLKCDYVATNQSEGSRIALSYLIGKGVRKIMYLVRTPITSTVITRISACQKTARDHGLPEKAIQVVECGDSLSSAYDMTYKVLGQYKDIKGIYAWDDVMAMGAIKAAFQLGLTIPDDISIVGYDDIEMAKYFNPAITTIRQNITQIGQSAAEILIQKINSGILYANKCIILEPELVIRETA